MLRTILKYILDALLILLLVLAIPFILLVVIYIFIFFKLLDMRGNITPKVYFEDYTEQS